MVWHIQRIGKKKANRWKEGVKKVKLINVDQLNKIGGSKYSKCFWY